MVETEKALYNQLNYDLKPGTINNNPYIYSLCLEENNLT